MEIHRIQRDKRKHLDLLLLADEQEEMIERYLDRGALFLLTERGSRRAAAVVTQESGTVCELKNLSVEPKFQRRGYGRALVGWLAGHYRDRFETMQVGTGEAPSTLAFYQSCGFSPSHRIPGFFTIHYDHPIVEDGVLLADMVVLSMPLKAAPIVTFREEFL
ncbi:GNAT family N-acetyltransferase [Yanshouia hominis]|uniref:GNAT family N-acetyltransferase n=1 Tax=Yanshouia hominis TaxID=2763673 RepID=UPI0021CC8D17|nr:GNAT family N-acetyltransferase [Yanshouia hominis]